MRKNLKTVAMFLPILLLAVGVYRHGGFGDSLTPCLDRLETFRAACEVYSTHHQGRYPATAAEVGCDTCPIDGIPYEYSSSKVPDRFTVMCRGAHFRKAGFREGYPLYCTAGGWCVAPGNYPNMRPDRYLELFDDPKL